MKPYAPACDRNRDAILSVLRRLLPTRADPLRVLEIGSGTGQHAVYFGAEFEHVVWQTSDRAGNVDGIRTWLDEAQLANVLPPLELDVMRFPSLTGYDGVFSANTAHIMAWHEVLAMLAGVGTALRAGGFFCLYGPFNRDGRFTSASNASFDADLKRDNPAMGIRDLAAIDAAAVQAGMQLERVVDMPANNQCAIWRRG